jgi:hypothetical protein
MDPSCQNALMSWKTPFPISADETMYIGAKLALPVYPDLAQGI